MTNLEKFIEIMNTTFDAKMTKDNLKRKCSPCGALKKLEYACGRYDCGRCRAWWHKEWIKPK